MNPETQTMQALDWVVIGGYAAGMIAIGFYFSRRTKNSEDYMLGGRRMSSWMVGCSLFATLMSAISYLMWPGEMIKYGPMMFVGLISYPFVYFVVAWLLIPQIMKARISSAYELLEVRLGGSVRTLASIFFLSMRITWMSVIIYMTSEKVIVPVMKWPSEYVVWVSITLGIVTVIYTALGGLRAVVLTDTIQTFILFCGAIVAVLLISVKMGGISAWWPWEWAGTWAEPKFGYDPNARVTFVGAFIAWFSWYVCTAGSDQMAIQRYLSTRDIKAARKAQRTALVADSLVSLLLGLVGLALLGYFRENLSFLPEGWTIFEQADKLFPHFIVICLPVGISGLVVAGLLAAAMSSLSSGLNSSCLVITDDFISRLLQRQLSEPQKVKLAKVISFAIGVVVLLLSTAVRHVRGNLLEVAYKTVNLLVAPLFVPFFMALFIRWANAFGTFVGMIVSVTVAVVIAFWQDFTGQEGISFLWIMPLSFGAGVTVSMLVSLLPVGRKHHTV